MRQNSGWGITTSAGRYRLTVERWPVTIAGVFLTASTSHNEFGQRIDGSSGSGVFHTGSLNTVRVFIASCMVVNNSAVFAAGLANCGLGAVMAVTDSAIASNVAANQGGGIYNWSPDSQDERDRVQQRSRGRGCHQCSRG